MAQSTPFAGIFIDSGSLGFSSVLSLIKALRLIRPHSAIVVFELYLTLEERLELFECGADDCRIDSCSVSEVLVRLKLLIQLRSAARGSLTLLKVDDLVLDLSTRQARRGGKVIDLRPKEFLLLEYLVRNVNRPLTRAMIIEQVWSSSFDGLTNVVDVYISSLRSKVDRGFTLKLIKTTRGVGYSLHHPTHQTKTARLRDHSGDSITLNPVAQMLG